MVKLHNESHRSSITDRKMDQEIAGSTKPEAVIKAAILRDEHPEPPKQ
jgi:hypothetical protein